MEEEHFASSEGKRVQGGKTFKHALVEDVAAEAGGGRNLGDGVGTNAQCGL
jgi:hypothetical protein